MALDSDLEQNYGPHSEAVRGMLRAEFGALLDEHEREDLCQTAWLALLEERERGREVRNVPGFLKTVAWRRARDRVRNFSAAPVDPLTGPLDLTPDEGHGPEDEATLRVEAARCRALVDELRPDEKAIITLRYGLELAPREIQRLLGIRRSRYNKLARRALERVAAAAESDLGEANRELLLAVEAGTATVEERERAAQLVKRDPASRAVLAEIRGWSRSAAAVLPFPILFGSRGGLIDRALAACSHSWETLAGGPTRAFANLASSTPLRGPGIAVMAATAGLGGAGAYVALEAPDPAPRESRLARAEPSPSRAVVPAGATRPTRASRRSRTRRERLAARPRQIAAGGAIEGTRTSRPPAVGRAGRPPGIATRRGPAPPAEFSFER